MSTTSASAAATTTARTTIQIVTTEMTFYSPIILLIIGITGCLCNFLTFTDTQLRKNPCAFYFLISAVFELLSITFGLISRFAADQLGSTLINTDRVYCKLRAYLVSALPLIATYLVLLASIDRCMSSSVRTRFRSFSQMKVAYRAIGVAIAIGFISCGHILFGYELRPKCAALTGAFAMYDGMFVVFWLGAIPYSIMLVFGFLTIMNIQRTKRRIAVKSAANTAAPTHQQRREQKTDAQLIVMMLVQVGFSSLLILTRMFYYAYYVLAPPLTGYNKLIGSFLMSFTTQLYYANYCKSFYIYTLSSQLFRSVFIQRVKFCIRKILGKHAPAIMGDTAANTIEKGTGTRTLQATINK